jgi:hypothetical protein
MKESQELGFHLSDWYRGTAERHHRPVQCRDIVGFMMLNNRLSCPGRIETEPGIRHWRLLAHVGIQRANPELWWR